MDKLRAIQYFNRSVETGSFGAAARAFEVSTPAVTQLVGSLERTLGVTLFHRSTRGLALTADGARYYEVSRRAAAELVEVEQHLGPRGARPRGKLTVGMRDAVGHNCVIPRITRFCERFPDIELALRPVTDAEEFDRADMDLAVLTGWPPDRDLAVRPLAQMRFVVCASPDYWRREGKPDEPEALRDHRCLVYRGAGAPLLDRWTFEKNGERRTIDVKSYLLCDQRTWHDEAVCAGAGVGRLADITGARYLASGLLVPVLTDWEGLEAPTIYAVYRRGQRQSKLVRVFLDFLVEVFAEIESDRATARGRGVSPMPRPEWYGRVHGRHSAYAARRRERSS